MDCPNCQGEVHPGSTSYTVNRNGYHLIIDDVPALVCDQCHDPLFAEDTVRLVQQMIRALDAHRQELGAIPVAA